MARTLCSETLGALIDRLSIVNLKLWHCQELLYGTSEPLQDRQALEEKNRSLLQQRARLIALIDQWIEQAVEDPAEIPIVSPQNKIYGRFRTDTEL